VHNGLTSPREASTGGVEANCLHFTSAGNFVTIKGGLCLQPWCNIFIKTGCVYCWIFSYTNQNHSVLVIWQSWVEWLCQ